MLNRILLSLAIVMVLAQAAAADRKKLVVVVVKGSPVTSISRTDLKHCFLGDSISSGGKTLVPFNAEAKTSDRMGFDRGALGMSPDEVGRFWVDRRVRGQGSAPRSLPSVIHMVKVVAKFPGAIGYVPVDQLTPELQPVKLDGVPYTDAGYALFTE